MRKIRAYSILLFLLASGVITTSPGSTEVSFSSSELRLNEKEARRRFHVMETQWVDFDGDGLDDCVATDGNSLGFFYQAPRVGFSKAVSFRYFVGDKGVLVWPENFKASSGHGLLMLTTDGVSELTYSDRLTSPTKTTLIQSETIIPRKLSYSQIEFFPLAVRTVTDKAIIIVPRRQSIDIWEKKKTNTWTFAYSLAAGPVSKFYSSFYSVGYDKLTYLNVAVADINNDGLDDLVLSDGGDVNGQIRYDLYSQTKDGQIPLQPTTSFAAESSWSNWVGFMDVNGDGAIDVLSNTWIQEPWFIPGSYSGKVLVRLYLGNKDKTLPASPQYLFRKHDWTPQIPLVDIDGDGRMDLILGYTRWKGREDLIKSLTSNEVAFNLRFHFYGEQGYGQSPDCQQDVRLYYEGDYLEDVLGFAYSDIFKTLISFEGDFNGDGRKDLLVKDTATQAHVYNFLSKAEGFSTRPQYSFKAEEIAQFTIRDLNHDGVSDLIVRSDGNTPLVVYLSQRK